MRWVGLDRLRLFIYGDWTRQFGVPTGGLWPYRRPVHLLIFRAGLFSVPDHAPTAHFCLPRRENAGAGRRAHSRWQPATTAGKI
jgi:hypothetical protein